MHLTEAYSRDAAFINRHKRSLVDFTRSGILSFQFIILMLLTKGKRSYQLALNESIPCLRKDQPTVSKVAYCKGRMKLKHTAFIELNQKTVVDVMYGDNDYKTWHNLRLLAIDGSVVILPETDDIRAEFGTVPYDNKQGHPKGSGEHVTGRASVLYDVLNRVVLDASLAPIKRYEGDLAVDHLKQVHVGDLVISDRGYASYRIMAETLQTQADFLIRCPKNRFPMATAMVAGEGPDDVIVALPAPLGFYKATDKQGLPSTLNVRFVRVILQDGTIEVLVTSLIDQETYPTTVFKELYYRRWGVETLYYVIKTRLGLENFSGYSVEAVKQDFYSMIFLTGSETLLTMDATEHLSRQHGGHPKKVNTAVAFHTIKTQALELYFNKKVSSEQKLEGLTALFLTSPTLIRKNRNPLRQHPSSRRLLGWWKRSRKEVF